MRVGFDGTSTYFLGSIDEVAVYKTALSAAQVLTHYKLWVKTIASSTRYLLGGLIETITTGTITSFDVDGPRVISPATPAPPPRG